MNYTREQLIECLKAEYEWLCNEGGEEETMSQEEYAHHLETLTIEQLIQETTTDSTYLTLEDYINYWRQND